MDGRVQGREEEKIEEWKAGGWKEEKREGGWEGRKEGGNEVGKEGKKLGDALAVSQCPQLKL